jgi:hypothetical protein
MNYIQYIEQYYITLFTPRQSQIVYIILHMIIIIHININQHSIGTAYLSHCDAWDSNSESITSHSPAIGPGTDHKINQFRPRPVQIPSLRNLGWHIQYMSGSICRLSHNPLHPHVVISSSAFQVVKSIIKFRYSTVNGNILTLVCHCLVWMYWPLL